MQSGEFTVVDATNSKTTEINQYKVLAKKYRYRIYIIDMTDVPIVEVKRRNAGRIPLKQVPESVIDKMYARFATQKIPSGVTRIEPEELDKIWYKPIDLSNYRKIVHIGDIHGCYTVLMEYLKDGLEDDVFYVFLGDYIDRGIENAEVIKFLLEIYERKNVALLTGNHECMHKDTEVLTNNGWKLLKDVDILSDKVAQYDLNTNEISYAEPFEKIENYAKQLIDIETFDTHQVVTFNHDIIYECRKIKAKEIFNIKNLEQNKFTHYGMKDQVEYNIEDNVLRLIVWIVTDGTIVRFENSLKRRIQFHFTRNNKIERLRNILNEMNIKYSYYPCKHKKPLPPNKQQDYVIIIYGQEARNYDDILNYKKEYPEFFAELNRRQAEVVIEELKHTDGREVSKLKVSYLSINKNNVDVIQRMCITNNMSCTMNYKDNYSGFKKGGRIYELTIKPYMQFPSYDVKTNVIDYNDTVYCLTMPLGTLVTRYNGKVVITGNCHLYNYSHDQIAKSREFELVTKKQLDEVDFDKNDLKRLHSKFAQCALYNFHEKEVLVCHGGISTLPDNLTLVASQQLIKGVGTYNDYEDVAEAWMQTTKENQYQVFGHRNTKGSEIQLRDRVFNLEGRVEFGGCLRVVELDHEGFHPVEVRNTVFRPKEEFEAQSAINSNDVAKTVLAMRGSKYIQEKQFENGISSFNFTKSAFAKGIWDGLTTHARGLFIDMTKMKVCARSYEKMFYLDSRDSISLAEYKDKVQYPVIGYVKENGFLGLLSYDEYADDFRFCTKSVVGGEYADWFKEIFYEVISEESWEKIKEYLKTENCTFVFEVIDPERDPHIIEYKNKNVVLLDVIKNSLVFSKLEYPELVSLAREFGLTYKRKVCSFSDWKSFCDWYEDVQKPGYRLLGEDIEGFVVSDASGFSFKLKTDYYNFWKRMRAIKDIVFHKGYIDKTSMLTGKTDNLFYGFLKKMYEDTELEKREELRKLDIITLRNMFYENLT